MKRVRLVIIMLLLFSVSFAELKIPKPTNEFFVNDFANVISESDEKIIFNKAKALYEKSGNSTQVVVVTIDSLEDYSIEEYANELFNEWGIGNKEKNDGVLILLSVEDKKSRIEVGYGLEGILYDGKTGRIQDDYMIPYYRNNDFSRGLVKGFNAVCGVIDGELVVKESNDSSMNSRAEDDGIEALFIGMLIGWITSIILSFIFSFPFGTLASFIIAMISFFLGWIFNLIDWSSVYGALTGFGMGHIVFVTSTVTRGGSRSSGGSRSGGGGYSGGGGRSGGGGSSRGF